MVYRMYVHEKCKVLTTVENEDVKEAMMYVHEKCKVLTT